MPAAAGAPKDENWERWLSDAFEGDWRFETVYQSVIRDPSGTPGCRCSAKSKHAYQLESIRGRRQPLDHAFGTWPDWW